MSEEFDKRMMEVPGLISPKERELLRENAEQVAKEFGDDIVIVNLGIFLGASCYCSRVGAPKARLYGVDVRGWERMTDDPPELREKLDMTLIQGDSMLVWKQFPEEKIHTIFIDTTHKYEVTKVEIKEWVFKFVVPGGYVLFHDAHIKPGNAFYESHKGVGIAIDEFMTDDWEEQERVDSTRWFKRKSAGDLLEDVLDAMKEIQANTGLVKNAD